jgi:acyl-CoA dehydrogenase
MRDIWDTARHAEPPEAEALREQVREIGFRSLRPYAADADRTGEPPADLLADVDCRTLCRLLIPAEHGGGWQSKRDTCLDIYRRPDLRVIVMEEAGYGDAGLLLALPGPALTAPILARADRLRERVFESFVEGPPTWAAFALSEPGAGSDVARLSTVATPIPDGYALDGTKWFVGHGARARWFVVFARVAGLNGPFAVRPFLVEQGTPGLVSGQLLPSLGLRGLGLAAVTLRGCRVPIDHALVPDAVRKFGDYPWNLTFRFFRPLVAALAVGTARAAVEYASMFIHQNGATHAGAKAWSALRVRFDAIVTRIHAARLMTWQAARESDQARHAIARASMAKNLAASVALEAATFAMEAAGIAGACRDAPAERLFRDAKAFDLLEGSGDIHRLLIARSLVGSELAGRVGGGAYGDETC